MKNLTTEELRAELERRGFYTANLWHVDDVLGIDGFEGGEKEAQQILDNVLTNEFLISQINDEIEMEVGL